MSSRWTEADANKYLQRVSGAAAPAPRARAPAPAKESRLEAELYGHLTVMQLAPVRQFRFTLERRWRFDFGFPAERICVDVDGGVFAAENGETAGRHARGAGIISGFEKRNAAAELGFFVLCYGPPQIRSGEAAIQIERLVKQRRLLGLPGDPAVQELLEHEDT